MSTDASKKDTCKIGATELSGYRTRLPGITEAIIASCSERDCQTLVDYEPFPSRPVVVEIIGRIRELLFPGYFSREKVDPLTLRYSMGQAATGVFDQLAEQICRSIRHDCFRYEQPCTDCENRGHETRPAVPPGSAGHPQGPVHRCARHLRRRPGCAQLR